MIFNSIRWRLQAWHGLILFVVLTGFGLTAFQVARDNQWRRINQELEQRLGFLAFSLMSPPRPHPPRWRASAAGAEDSQIDRRPDTRRAPEGMGEAGPPPDGHRRPHPGLRMNPQAFCERLTQSLERRIAAEAGQTNAFYFVAWGADGKELKRSPGAPGNVPRPKNLRPVQAADAFGWLSNHQEVMAVRQAVAIQPAGAASPLRPNEPEPARARPSLGPGLGPMAPGMRTRGDYREAYKFLPFGACLLVGRSMAPEMAAMRRLAYWLVGAGAGVLMIGLAGGWWVASRAIRPIDAISQTAVKIAAGDLAQRINTADTESELGRLASVLNSTFARLEAAFAHQSRFTSDASHELRTPVSVILSQTQTILSRERSGMEYREALQACQRAAQRMRNLTQSLLELARLDAGQAAMQRESFDLTRAARESMELVRPLAAERGVELRGELTSAQCQGDAERVGQVVTNLLTNAIHFNRDHGEVRVSTGIENGNAFLSVTDTGQGIPPEDLPHIFERFYRVDKSRSRIQGRTGLGLAICKAIIDAHSGVIEVTSRPGAGSTFTVKLPFKQGCD
jgi:two-component system, OmpR family, sensor kinase